MKYQSRLLTHLKDERYEPKGIDAVGEELRVDDPERFRAEVQSMRADGSVEVTPKGHLILPSIDSLGEELTGVFKGNNRGFGFVRPEGIFREGDIFIPPDSTSNALSGDVVRIGFSRDRFREKRVADGKPSYSGWVIEVLERKRGAFSGEIFKQGSQWLVQPDGSELTGQIVVRDAESKNVKPGDKVVVELVEYPKEGQLAQGVITRVLGEAGRPDVETEAVIAAFALPGEFPEECVQQAREASIAFDEQIKAWQERGASTLVNREDRTRELIITIDPPDAKDYDDAIGIKPLPDGGWELGIYIADVAHFIEPGSKLDVEAAKRGNSVYLPRLVIPMLPEVLSNGICSLQEGVPRFVKAAYMRYDRQGNRVSEGVGQALIKSRKRLTYLEAQALIDGDKTEAERHARTEPIYTDEVINACLELDKLTRQIQGRRQRQGMISLELPQVDLVFDENGHVIDAVPEDDAYTHTLIEMCMVEANEVLARLFEDLDVPLIRRVHPEPTPGDSANLQRTAMVAGFRVPEHPTREELQGLLNATRGTPAARAVHMAVLRTLTKAEYAPTLVGHFALASEAYAHFTSPIRRYPDLTVHRALAAYIERTNNGTNRPKDDQAKKKLGRELREDRLCPPKDVLVEVARHCTATEQNAEDAERQLRSFLVLQVIAEHHLEDEFEGVITGVTPRGIYIQLSKYLAEGMIKVADLPGDTTRSNKPPNWKIDPRSGALLDLNSGRSFSTGHMVTVRIASIDLQRREMSLVIANDATRAAGKARAVPGLTLGEGQGGVGGGGGAGFKELNQRTGSQRRSAKSKRRDKGKTDYRDDRKPGGGKGGGKGKKK